MNHKMCGLHEVWSHQKKKSCSVCLVSNLRSSESQSGFRCFQIRVHQLHWGSAETKWLVNLGNNLGRGWGQPGVLRAEQSVTKRDEACASLVNCTVVLHCQQHLQKMLPHGLQLLCVQQSFLNLHNHWMSAGETTHLSFFLCRLNRKLVKGSQDFWWNQTSNRTKDNGCTPLPPMYACTHAWRNRTVIEKM